MFSEKIAAEILRGVAPLEMGHVNRFKCEQQLKHGPNNAWYAYQAGQLIVAVMVLLLVTLPLFPNKEYGAEDVWTAITVCVTLEVFCLYTARLAKGPVDWVLLPDIDGFQLVSSVDHAFIRRHYPEAWCEVEVLRRTKPTTHDLARILWLVIPAPDGSEDDRRGIRYDEWSR